MMTPDRWPRSGCTRFLAAAATHAGDDAHGLSRLADLPEPSAPEPTAAEVRAWAARRAGGHVRTYPRPTFVRRIAAPM
jgi:hypothetical protein